MKNMKQIIKFSQEKYNWTLEFEVAKFPNILKKDKCQECSQLLLDATKKDLVLAKNLLEVNGEKKKEVIVYTCFRHSRSILGEPKNPAGSIKVENLAGLEAIRQELKKHE